MARSGVRRPENTTMQQMQLWIFWAIVGAFIVCGCVLTRKPTKKPPTETLRKAQSIVEDVDKRPDSWRAPPRPRSAAARGSARSNHALTAHSRGTLSGRPSFTPPASEHCAVFLPETV